MTETPSPELSEELFEHLPVPALRGFSQDGALVVTAVNGAFGTFWGSRASCPCSVETLFAGLAGPRSFATLERSVAVPGWHRELWDIVPGERLADLAVYADEEGRFFAFLPECSEQMILRRFQSLREKITFLLRVHGAHEAFAPLTACLTEFFGFEWTGVLEWDSTELQWTPLVEAPHPLLLPRDDHRLEAFLAALAVDRQGIASGHHLGDLSVTEGEEWWVRWLAESGAWRSAMESAELQSLFAGTLLGGAHPLVFVALSRREGALGRINGDAWRALWPTLCSTAERYRVVRAMACLANTDRETGLMATAPLRRRLQEELRRSRRYGYLLSLVRLTLLNAAELVADDPENLADALRSLGHDVTQSIRTVDVAGRLDQNALLLILPHTDAPGREVVERRLKERAAVSSPFQYLAPEIVLGGVTFEDGPPETIEEALQRCEAAESASDTPQ